MSNNKTKKTKKDFTPEEIRVIKGMLNYKNKTDQKDIKSQQAKWEVLTPELNLTNGWFLNETIRSSVEALDFRYQNNKRWDILNQSLTKTKQVLEHDIYKYRPRKDRFASVSVYRIRRDNNIFIKLFNYFYENEKTTIYDFLNSDYFQDSQFRKDSYDSLKVLLKLNWKKVTKMGPKELKTQQEQILKEVQASTSETIRISPSFIYNMINNVNSVLIMMQFSSVEDVIRAYLIVDCVSCNDFDYRRLYETEIERLKKTKRRIRESNSPEHKKTQN